MMLFLVCLFCFIAIVTCESRCLLSLFQFSFYSMCELQVSTIFGVSFRVGNRGWIPWLTVAEFVNFSLAQF